jgi:hypothetical protein
MKNKTNDEQVDRIMEGLTGDLQIGKKYYILTFSYHYIGVVSQVDDKTVYLDASSVMIVTNAGGESDAVSQILNGKKKPEVSEQPHKIIKIRQGAIIAIYDF